MKLLTFLGKGNYKPTRYVWAEIEHETCFAPVASYHFLKPDTVTFFLTEEAQSQVFPELKKELPANLDVQTIPVPLGGTESELWQIFEQVSNSVLPQEEIAFDITHGLRSFPLVGLLVAAFLRTSKEVSLKAMLYGAYDVGVQLKLGYTPVFDLSPMLSLLEWSVAAERFNRTGDARYLASLVERQRKDLALAAKGDQERVEKVGHLGNLAGALTNISQSLRLIRPHQAMEQIAGLPERTQKAEAILQQTAPASPFAMVLDDVVQSYQNLANPQPLAPDHVRRTLSVTRELIHWYIEHEQWVQAISLAREWLLSWVMVQLGQTNIVSQNARKCIENVIGSEADNFKNAKKANVDFEAMLLQNIPQIENVLSLWLEVCNVRNDIDHAGMRNDPGEPQSLITRIKKCEPKIDELSL